MADSGGFVKVLANHEPSRIMCKLLEGFSLPGTVQVTDDTEDDPVTAGRIGKTRHGAGPAANFAEGPLDHIGGAHLDPMGFGNGEEVE